MKYDASELIAPIVSLGTSGSRPTSHAIPSPATRDARLDRAQYPPSEAVKHVARPIVSGTAFQEN
jgi:hypothetical protein